MTTVEELRAFEETVDLLLSEGQRQALGMFIDGKCKAAFDRGKHMNDGEIECLHDRIDELAITLSRYGKEEEK